MHNITFGECILQLSELFIDELEADGENLVIWDTRCRLNRKVENENFPESMPSRVIVSLPSRYPPRMAKNSCYGRIDGRPVSAKCGSSGSNLQPRQQEKPKFTTERQLAPQISGFPWESRGYKLVAS